MLKREEAIDNIKEVINYLKFEVRIEGNNDSYFYAEINKLKKVLEFLEG
tara:strand:- start:139 stop:285 length:147 start_codon:yes stop_codon:yes gene_type:complete